MKNGILNRPQKTQKTPMSVLQVHRTFDRLNRQLEFLFFSCIIFQEQFIQDKFSLLSLYQSIYNFNCSSHLFLQFTILLTFISLLCDRIKFLLFRWKSLADVQNRLLKKKVRVNFRKHEKKILQILYGYLLGC